MFTIYSLCDTCFAQKPDKNKGELTHIYDNLKHTKKSLSELLEDIRSGRSFTPAIFNGSKSIANFFTTQLFGVDIDNEDKLGNPLPEMLTLEGATHMLREYDLMYTFGYYTFSHTEDHPKFRLMFLLDKEVRDAKLADDILKSMKRFFEGKSDEACHEVSRLFHGTNKGTFEGDMTYIPYKEFINALNRKTYALGRNQLRGGHIEMDNILVQNGKNYIRYNSISHFAQDDDDPKDDHSVIEKVNWDDLCQKCQLLREFLNGTTKIYHKELLSLATNMIHLKGGQKKFRDTIRKYKQYDIAKIRLLDHVEGYRPHWIASFSPFENDKQISGSLVDLALKRGLVNITEKKEFVDLATAEKRMVQYAQDVIAAPTNDIYLFRCIPGLGKTTFFESLEGIVLGFPSHKLKEEKYLVSQCPNKLQTPDINKFFSTELLKKFNAHYEMDLAEKVQQDIKELAKGVLVSGADFTDIEAAISFLGELQTVREAAETTTIFTTHHKALYDPNILNDTVVIDEDPLMTILVQRQVKIDDFRCLRDVMERRGHDVSLLQAILERSDMDTYEPTPVMFYNRDIIHGISMEQKFKTNLCRFFDSTLFMKTGNIIHFVKNNVDRFLPNRKYIILDATTSVSIYRQLFGDRLKVIDITNVAFKGKLIQDTRISYSRQSIVKNGKKLRMNNDYPTLTFKGYEEYIENSVVEHYIHGLAGTNKYENGNLNVVATPHPHINKLKMLNAVFNLGVTNWQMQNQRTNYDGREFLFYTFLDECIRQIHLEMVEGELIQAVHRARLIRKENTVYLFSNFPLLQAEYKF